MGGVGGDSSGGASPSLKLCYGGYGHPLVLLLEDHGVVTDCQVRTKEAEECLDFNFTNSKIVSKIIVNSDHLKDVFSELDSTSEYIEFLISPAPPRFQIRTNGPAGDCTVSVPSTSNMIELFKSESTSTARYRLAMLKNGTSCASSTWSAQMTDQPSSSSTLLLRKTSRIDDRLASSFTKYLV